VCVCVRVCVFVCVCAGMTEGCLCSYAYKTTFILNHPNSPHKIS